MEQSIATLVAAVVIIFLVIMLNVYIMRWIFKIDTIVRCQQMQVALLVKLAQKAGAEEHEIIDTITSASDQRTAKRIVEKIK